MVLRHSRRPRSLRSAFKNILIEPVSTNALPLPPLLPFDINLGQEHGTCFFSRYRDVADTYEKFRQVACLEVCTGDCGKPYVAWKVHEELLGQDEKVRRMREQFVRSFTAPIVALKCAQTLNSLR
jgi:hypothetical protein